MSTGDWMADDLTGDALAAALGDRPFRTYPALLSTEADALAWARAGGPQGAVVVAGYQAAPRGRGGLPWQVPEEGALAFSTILRPDLPAEREGWLYLIGAVALADALGDDGGTFAWPDEVHRRGPVPARLAVQTDIGPARVNWGVMSAMVPEVRSPRGQALARFLDALDRRSGQPHEQVLASARERCTTIGRSVSARLIPMGPRGVVVEGRAQDLTAEGCLVVDTPSGRRQPVRPQDLGVLDLR